MREIKFRGKRTENLMWIEGGYVEWVDIHDHRMFHIISRNGYHNDVIPETVGQFTGLLDKNGKEVYEGDIIFESTDGINTGWEIRYDVSLSQYRAENISDERDDIQLNAVWLDRSEIIGNIHDNPELIHTVRYNTKIINYKN